MTTKQSTPATRTPHLYFYTCIWLSLTFCSVSVAGSKDQCALLFAKKESAALKAALNPNFFYPLIENEVFVSQFDPGIHRTESTAIGAPTAIVNSVNAIYFSLSGGRQAVSRMVAIKLINTIWNAVKPYTDVSRSQEAPTFMFSGLMLGAAHEFKIDSYVVPIQFSGPKIIANRLNEIVTTRSRIRNIGVTDGKNFRVLTVLGMDFETKQLIVSDPNNPNILAYYEMEVKSDGVYIGLAESGANIVKLLTASSKTKFLITDVFGLNIKEP